MKDLTSSGFFIYEYDNNIGMILLPHIKSVKWVFDNCTELYTLFINDSKIYITKNKNNKNVKLFIDSLKMHIRFSITEDYYFNKEWVVNYD